MATWGPVHGAVFDMDGTLLDTEPLYKAGWLSLLPEYGVEVDESTYHALIPGRTGRAVAHEIFGLPIEQSDELVGRIMRQFWEIAATGLEPLPGLIPVLDRLSHLPMAVATSNRRADALRIIDALGLPHRFRTLIGAEDVQRGKPDPEPFLRAAAVLGVAAERCVAFEDSVNGVASAMAAGMFCVGIGPAALDADLPVTGFCDPRLAAWLSMILDS